MTGNQSFFSQLLLFDSLPSVTLVDGSQIKVRGIGQTHPLPNLPLNFVLFVPSCPSYKIANTYLYLFLSDSSLHTSSR